MLSKLITHHCRHGIPAFHRTCRNVGRRVSSLESPSSKPAGDISAGFPSLSGVPVQPLPHRFAELKTRLLQGREDQLRDGWERLLVQLQGETMAVREMGSKSIPEIEFGDLHDLNKRTLFRDTLHKHGVAVIRGVVTEKEALGWKELAQRYIRNNPQTKGFPAQNPAIYELYWSPSQILARAHPNLIKAQAFLMSHWHSARNRDALISTAHPTSYADRLRIRQPGDAGFALGPHVDGGSCERWEENGYGKGGIYDKIFHGQWEEYDPWESSSRLPVVSDLYNGAGACSMFRMFQGWLSMSATNPGEGTLMVNPLLGRATAYYLLRPFFTPKRGPSEDLGASFLKPANWKLEDQITSTLQGAIPSCSQELNSAFHPHLELENTMVHIPSVRPGDYVVWHCDTVHAVDRVHAGKSDSSVLYIPACPLTEVNAQYLTRQREAFWQGSPGPDFPSGDGEAQHVGRLSPDYVMQNINLPAQRAMGLARWDDTVEGIPERERRMLAKANEILGFA